VDFSVTTLATKNLPDDGIGLAMDKYGVLYLAECWWLYRFNPASDQPPEMVYQSDCFHGGIAYIDYDARHNVIAYCKQNCNSWGRLPVVSPRGLFPPTSLTADYFFEVPPSVHLQWVDPTSRFDGSQLLDFKIHVYRGLTVIAEVDSGIQSFTDTDITLPQI
jgi:hypothetical protein